MVMLISSITVAQVQFSGDATMVTTYVWRGVKQYNGPALQGTAGFEAGLVSFGLWCSSVDFGGDTEVETDPYVELSFPTGSVSTSIGATMYSYDFFETFNADADYEFELFGTFGVGPVGLAAFYVPSQASTENNLNESDYWIEASLGANLRGADLGVLFGFGTYSSKWLAEPKEDAVSHVVLSAGKTVNENVAVNWSYSISMDSDMDDQFWMTFGYGF
jgi:uncharacterized protein (TIGR02001 family)